MDNLVNRYFVIFTRPVIILPANRNAKPLVRISADLLNQMNSRILILVSLTIFSCKNENNYTEIKEILEKVFDDDQKLRANNIYSSDQAQLDEKNLGIVAKIIDSVGWIGKDKIGEKANDAIFLTIQHANKLETMEKFLPIMKEAVNNGSAEKKQLAYLIDRIETLNGRKQIYGTQYSVNEHGKIIIKELVDSVNVNSRRKSMNLIPIEEYIKMVESEK